MRIHSIANAYNERGPIYEWTANSIIIISRSAFVKNVKRENTKAGASKRYKYAKWVNRNGRPICSATMVRQAERGLFSRESAAFRQLRWMEEVTQDRSIVELRGGEFHSWTKLRRCWPDLVRSNGNQILITRPKPFRKCGRCRRRVRVFLATRWRCHETISRLIKILWRSQPTFVDVLMSPLLINPSFCCKRDSIQLNSSSRAIPIPVRIVSSATDIRWMWKALSSAHFLRSERTKRKYRILKSVGLDQLKVQFIRLVWSWVGGKQNYLFCGILLLSPVPGFFYLGGFHCVDS